MDTAQVPEKLQNQNVSDGSELIPAGVEARKQREGISPSEVLPEDDQDRDRVKTQSGYAVDKQGRLNNYAVTPPVYMQRQRRFGFTKYAETYNGRLAMIGFVLLVAIEIVAGQSFISLIS